MVRIAALEDRAAPLQGFQQVSGEKRLGRRVVGNTVRVSSLSAFAAPQAISGISAAASSGGPLPRQPQRSNAFTKAAGGRGMTTENLRSLALPVCAMSHVCWSVSHRGRGRGGLASRSQKGSCRKARQVVGHSAYDAAGLGCPSSSRPKLICTLMSSLSMSRQDSGRPLRPQLPGARPLSPGHPWETTRDIDTSRFIATRAPAIHGNPCPKRFKQVEESPPALAARVRELDRAPGLQLSPRCPRARSLSHAREKP